MVLFQMFKIYKSLIYKFCCHYENDRLNFAILTDSYPLSRYHQRLKSHYFLAFYIFFLRHFCVSSYRGKNILSSELKNIRNEPLWTGIERFFSSASLLFGLSCNVEGLGVFVRFFIYIPANHRFHSLKDILHILQKSSYSLNFYPCISGFRSLSSNIFLLP